MANAMKCECVEPGFCSRHNLYKNEALHGLCQQNRDVFLAYEVDAGNIVEPGIVTKVANYAVAKTQHVVAGSPQVDDAVYAARLATCAACPLLKDGVCLQCGCPMEAKARWADVRCPLDPPKWDAVSVAKSGGCRGCNKN